MDKAVNKKKSVTEETDSKDIINTLHINTKELDNPKEHTAKKIEYVANYVRNWLYVWSNEKSIKSISFIDAMTNAGIYKSGELGTAIEVYKLLINFAKEHPLIKYRIFINDINKKRIDICLQIMKHLKPEEIPNLSVIYATKDVNIFLQEAANTNKIPKGYGNAVLMFVDPYNARTVHLDNLRQFIKSRYCEILFNWFSSDYTRNRNERNYEAIRDCFDGLEISKEENAVEAISNALRVGDIKYVFSYPFRISTNVEIYQIIFLTPNPKGLEKLKDALWETFKGEEFHKNKNPRATYDQLSMFDLEGFNDLRAELYSENAKELLLKVFSGEKSVRYDEMVTVLLERTMLKKGHILNYVVKPLIENHSIIKDGNAKPRTFITDTYSFS